MKRTWIHVAGFAIVGGLVLALIAYGMEHHARDGVTIEACTVDAGYPVVTVRIHNGSEAAKDMPFDVLLAGQRIHQSVQMGPGQTLHWRVTGEQPGPAECELGSVDDPVDQR